MAEAKKQAKKSSSKKKSPSWTEPFKDAFKRAKRLGLFSKTAKAGSPGVIKTIKGWFSSGYDAVKSVWVPLVGTKKEKKMRAAEYEAGGYIVKGDRVMMHKKNDDDTFRVDKKTGDIFRYRTSARLKKRIKSRVVAAQTIEDLPAIDDNQKYVIYLQRGRGKSATWEPKIFDDLSVMAQSMGRQYQNFANWAQYVEIIG